MRVFLNMLLIIVLIFTVACSAKVSGREDALQKVQEKNYEKTIYWMPVENQKIQIVFDEKESNLLIVSYLTIDKSRLNNTNELSFLIDEDTKLQSFTINNESRPIERILQYDENNFEKTLEYAFVEKIRFFANIWKFTLTDEDLAQDKINLMVKYTISNQSKDEAYSKDKDGFALNGDLWWYPSTMNDGGNIQLELNIKDDFEVLYANKPLPYDKLRSYKFYKHTVQNLFDAPLSLEAKKVNK
ncbi:hypothetical protein JEZ13_03755 [bacterium]|nr:hypothetical protein [bacterium]